MPEPLDPPPNLNLGDLGAIQNLDTARMALRWALERLRVLDQARQEAESLGRRMQREAVAGAAEGAYGDLARARLEGWLLDLLAERVDTEALREALTPRVAQLEREAVLKRGALEGELHKAGPAFEAAAPLAKSLSRVKEIEARLSHWENLIAENAQLSGARGALAHKMRELKSSLMKGAEAPAEPAAPEPEAKAAPVAEPAERASENLVRIEALETLREEWRREKAALQEELRRREEVIAKLPAAPPSAPAALPSLMPPQLTRALAEKFSVMLSSWEEWEESRRKVIEEEREAQRRALLSEVRQAEDAGQPVHALLAQARRRMLEEAAKSQAAACEEFRRVLQGWEMEHAARRKAAEEALTAERARLAAEVAAHARAVAESGTPEAKAVVSQLRERLASQEAHYQRLLSQEREAAQAALEARVEEEGARRKAWEVSSEVEKRRLQVELDRQFAKSEELSRRDVETRAVIAQLRKELQETILDKDADARARQRALEEGWSEEKARLTQEVAERTLRAGELERRVEEQRVTLRQLQDRLAAELRGREESEHARLQERDRATQALAKLRAELEKATQEHEDYRRLQESHPPAAPGLPWAEAEALRQRAQEAENALRERYMQDLNKGAAAAQKDSEELKRLRAALARTQGEFAAYVAQQEKARGVSEEGRKESAELRSRLAEAEEAAAARGRELDAARAQLKEALDGLGALAAAPPAVPVSADQAPTMISSAPEASSDARLQAKDEELAAMAKRLEEAQAETARRLAEQEAEFEAVKARLSAVCDAYLKELAAWERGEGGVS